MQSTSGYFQIGELRVARVEESCQAAFPPEVMFPNLPHVGRVRRDGDAFAFMPG